MRSTEKGFTLYYYDGGGIDKIVYFFTENRGVISGVAKGAKKSKNRFGGNLEPFNEVEIILYEKENSELPIIEKVNIIEENFRLFENMENFNYLLTIADIIIRLTPHNVPQDKLFRLLKATVNALKKGGNAEKLFSYFLIWFLRIEGMLPAFNECHVCGKKIREFEKFYISEDGSKIFCDKCKTQSSIPIPSSFLIFSKLSKSLPPEKCSEIEFGKMGDIKRFLIKLVKVYGESEIKSLRTVENL